MTPEEHWTEHAPRPRRPRLGPLLHRVAAELPHISAAKGMRMEGGTRLAFLSFYGVQNARTLVVHAAEPTSKSVSLLALDEAFLRAAVAAAGWTRGPVQHDQVEAAAPLARWLGPRGSSVALADLGLDAFAEAYYGRLREAAGAPGSPSVASVVPVSLPPSPAEEESYPLSPPEVISDVYGGAREAALNAIDFEEVRLRTRRPLPNPRPHAQHLVLGARIDNIERLINEKLDQADELSVGGVGLAC